MAAVLEFRLTGGSVNSDPDLSLGGAMSSEEISATPLNNLFDNVNPAEAFAGDTEYRAIDIYNSGDADAVAIELYIDDQPDHPNVTIEVALDFTTQAIADEDTEPTSVTFSSPTSLAKLSVGDIVASSAQRLWVKRIVASSAGNFASDTCGVTVQYA